MTKKQQLQQELFNLKAKAKTLMNQEGVTKEELDEVNNQIQLVNAKLSTLEATEDIDNEPQNRQGARILTNPVNVDSNARYEEAFYNALRGRATDEDMDILDARNALSSSIEGDGGFLIPVDQQTEINELKRQYSPLRELVTVEPVSTLTGSRVLEKDAEHTPFTEFTENQDGGLETVSTPQFTPVRYTIKNYGGILPVPRTLLQDQKANLRGYLNKWLAKKSVATENNLILSVINTLTKVPMSNIDDIKYAIDVTLDPAIAVQAKVVTNQDGFNYLNTLKDSQGNYLLEKDPKNATKKLINGKEIVILSNKQLKTTGTTTKKAPLIIGSLKEAVVLFDRETTEIKSTDVGGDAFKNNRVDIRAIMRLDVKKFDTTAVIFGEIELPTVGA